MVSSRSEVEVREYTPDAGKSPFAKWFEGLNSQAAVKVTTALERITQGNFSNAKSVGAGVLEYKIHFGPGYRVYFGKDGDTLVILLGGGSKKNQSAEISAAQEHWEQYKRLKRRDARRIESGTDKRLP